MSQKAWIELSEQGYWVFPTKNRNKYPTTLGQGKTWNTFIEDKEHELLHAHLLHDGSTGAALCPQQTDKVPLLILDLDTYGMDLQTVWTHLCPGRDGTPPPPTLVVGSPSGGFHVWFRLPEGVNPDQMPASFDFGGGLSGEVRASSKARRLIMLPGSTAINKNSKTAKYTILSGQVDLETLSEPPEELVARLLARQGQGVGPDPQPLAADPAQPTEAVHFLEMLEGFAPQTLKQGDRNNFVARCGQILGRLHPGKQCTPEIAERIWSSLQPRLGEGFSEKEFRVALNSGWATGSRNGEKYSGRHKHPTVSDIRDECKGVFTEVPWLVEIRDSSGKTKEWIVGFGGSAKRRHEATKVTRLQDLRDILPTLTRLTSANMDTVARSPLFIQAGWSKVLDYMLSAEKAVDQLGIPPEERFWELLEDWSRIAAADLLFLEAWTEKRPLGAAVAFIVWPVTEDQPPSLVIPPLLQETLLTQLGDIPKAKRLVNKHLLHKTLVGMRSGQKVWACPLLRLESETQEFIGAHYERFVQKRQEGAL